MTILALALVLVLAWLILKALASSGMAKTRSGRVRITETLPLGTRERLVIVEHDGHEYLLGVSSASVNLLEKKPLPPATDNTDH
ncbi:MAG: flagellar biosynthetic protein FliO [Gammaproteobacteria bacterium]|nr:flagellar biosynthetic protein FliO [Gammaproteobacteria bacterium]